MTQEACEIGLSLTQTDFDRIGSSTDRMVELYTLQSSSSTPARTKRGRVSIEGLDESEVETRIVQLNGNLLGVCFFHRMPGFELLWDLGLRAMTIRRVS